MATVTEITPALIRQLVDYDADSGTFVWKVRDPALFAGGYFPAEHDARIWNDRHAGKSAFTANHRQGYLIGCIFNRKVLAHRAAWAHYYGEFPLNLIDHINGDKRDNRIVNLRSVTQSINMRNAQHNKQRKSGHLGVSLQYGNRWYATGYLNKRPVHIGVYDTLEEAIAARKLFERQNGFTDRHGYSECPPIPRRL